MTHAAPPDHPSEPADDNETVENPSELIRVSAMTARLLEEAHDAPLDDAGCRRMVEIHHRALEMLEDTLSTGLRSELLALAPPVEGPDMSAAELRVVQAQLVGWLDGLMVSLQAELLDPAGPVAAAGEITDPSSDHSYL